MPSRRPAPRPALAPASYQDWLADLHHQLRYLLNRWDPIGIYDEDLDFPPDEYDCLIGPLTTRLADSVSQAQMSEFLWRETEDHFGLDPLPRGTDQFAGRLIAWFAAVTAASCPV